ncbi:MAG: energy-coupling factor transporter transmembrane component T [Methanoregula sp.]|jgi:cobalt/nickel transport system permease protein
MSSTSLSPHIPDLDLITYYAEKGDSIFSRVSPWTKGCLLFFIVLLVTVSRSLVLLFGLYLVVLLLYLLAGLPAGKLAYWYTLPALFVISLVGIMMWNEPGIPLFSWTSGVFTLTLTDNGALLVVTLLIKALITVTFSLFFLMTTRYQHFAGIISRIFPEPLDQIFLMAYRFIFLTLAMTSSLLKSIKSRGGGLMHSLRMQGRLFAGVFALIFIRSFERGERVHKAMISRGFSGSYPLSGEVPRPAPAEYGLLFVTGALVSLIVFLSPYRGW